MKKLLLLLLSVFLFFIEIQAQSCHVLFIGNSYTYVNNLPDLVSQMYAESGDSFDYTMSAPGGCTFQQHCSVSLPYIQQGGWDYVVLQEQSQLPSFPESQFMQESYPYAQELCSLIRQYSPDAKIVFYMTWGRENGDPQNGQYFPPLNTYEGMDSLLYLRYMKMAQDNQACVSPSGPSGIIYATIILIWGCTSPMAVTLPISVPTWPRVPSTRPLQAKIRPIFHGTAHWTRPRPT